MSAQAQTAQVVFDAGDLYNILKEVASRDKRAWDFHLALSAYDSEGKNLGNAEVASQYKKVDSTDGHIEVGFTWTAPDGTARIDATLKITIAGSYGGRCTCPIGTGFSIDNPPRSLGIVVRIPAPQSQQTSAG